MTYFLWSLGNNFPFDVTTGDSLIYGAFYLQTSAER